MNTMPATRPPRTPATVRMTPGRWIALAIGVPIALAFIGWTGFSLVSSLGRASFPVNTAIPVRDGHLVASTGGGDLTVHQGQASRAEARLTGTVQYSLVRPRLTISADGLHLNCRLPTGDCGLNATLDVPLNTAVQLASQGGNMQVNGIDSDVALNSDGGDVTVSRVTGIADVTTGGGNLTASDLGKIRQFSTDGGDVDGTGLFAPQVTTQSGGGNVTLVFTTVPTSVTVTSDGGDIHILVPRGSTPYYIASSTDGGDYGAQVPTTANPKASHQITVNSGGGNVSIAES